MAGAYKKAGLSFQLLEIMKVFTSLHLTSFVFPWEAKWVEHCKLQKSLTAVWVWQLPLASADALQQTDRGGILQKSEVSYTRAVYSFVTDVHNGTQCHSGTMWVQCSPKHNSPFFQNAGSFSQAISKPFKWQKKKGLHEDRVFPVLERLSSTVTEGNSTILWF